MRNSRVKYTIDSVPYLTERHGSEFGYKIPIQEEGTYTLILKFVEVNISI